MKKKPGQKSSKKSARRQRPIKATASAHESPATIVRPCEAPPKTVPVQIRTKFYGNDKETNQTIQIPVVDRDMIRLDMTIDLRKSEYIEIRPLRRNLEDVAGVIADAESLANEIHPN